MDNFDNIPDEVNNPEASPADLQPEPIQTAVSYRKSGPAADAAVNIMAHHRPADAYVPEISLYEEAAQENERRKKENSRFYRFIAGVLILSMVGAPFLGLGFGLGTRLFDNYFLPILLDDSSERANFSFDNAANMPLGAETPIVHRQGYVELVQLVEPSVVLITSSMAHGRRFFDFNFGAPTSAGSGIIMYETSTRYYIATNAHVIEGATEVHVSIAGSPKIPAVPVGRDDEADLAVIAVNKAAAIQQGVHSVRIARFGDSSAVQVGEAVLAIGNSMGEGNTVTNGIISAIEREIFVANRHLSEVLQTNAAINQGNSGGPLINLYGEVIGINTAKFSERLAEGMGYAIPSNVAMPILERIMRDHDGTASQGRPMIGITFRSLDGLSEAYFDYLAGVYDLEGDEAQNIPTQGLIIVMVVTGSPADTAGLRPYDIITAVNGQPITTDYQIIDIFTASQVGDVVDITIIRDGTQELTIPVTLGPPITSF